MKKFRFWFVFSLIVVFLAGVVGGIFFERYLISKKTETRRYGFSPYPSFKELNLSPEQQEKIKEIFQKNDERIRDLRTDFFKHLEEMRAQLKNEIDNILTAEQKQKLEEMIKKFREHRQREYEKRERKYERQRPRKPNKENDHEKEDYPRSSNPGGYHRYHPGIYPY